MKFYDIINIINALCIYLERRNRVEKCKCETEKSYEVLEHALMGKGFSRKTASTLATGYMILAITRIKDMGLPIHPEIVGCYTILVAIEDGVL